MELVDKKLRILILEDVSADAEMMERKLHKGGIQFSSKRVGTKKAFLEELKEFEPDLILGDYKLPSFDGLSALGIVQEKCPDVPFIFISGTIGEELAIETLKSGATDYVLKDRLSRLVPAVTRALREVEERTKRKQADEALRRSEERFRLLAESSLTGIYLFQEGHFLYVNKALASIFGYTVEELVGRLGPLDLTHPDDRAAVRENVRRRLSGEVETIRSDFRGLRKDGTVIFVEVHGTRIEYGGKVGIIGTLVDITERKRAEEALRESEERIKSIFRAAPIGIGVVTNRVLMDVNSRIGEMTGYSLKELVSSSARVLYPTQDDFDYVGAEKYRQIAEKGAGSVETRWMKKDGTIIDVLLSSTPIDPSDLSRGVTFTALDITEPKKVEEALKESEKKYRRVVENATEIIYTTDINGNFKYANPTALRVVGYSLEELRRFNYLDLVVPEYRDQLKEIYGNQFRSRQATTYVEFPFSNKFGEVMWFGQSASLMMEGGRIIGFQVIARDITERKRTESALRESEERYRMLVETSPDAITLLDLNLNIVMANRPALALYGYESPEEVVGQSALNFIAPEDRPRAVEDVRKMLETGSIGTLEYTLLRKGGVPFSAELRASMIVNVEKKPLAYICVSRDITERKRGEEERAALEDQFRQSQKMEAIGQLAGGVAHDFNNLLTVIKGYCQLSLVETKEGTPLRDALEVISKAAEKAADLTRQLLAFSRRQIMEATVLDLNTLLQNLEKMLRRIIGEDIELVTLLGADLGRVKADPGQMEQVVMNLAVNAKDAMSKGGKLIIETANVELDEAYARAHVSVTPGCYVMIAVSDTGTGMAPEVRDRVFEPFFTTKGKGKGTGLGLSTVYGIVKQSNGNIWVYSEPGKGTTFKIFLPRVDEPAEKLKAQEAGEEFPGGSETILIVEDDKEVRNLTVRILKRQGYTVLDGSYGDEAFNVCRQHKGPIHLLVTDVVMPGMDGRTLSECLSQLHPEMKVLYMSGYTDDAIVHHGVMAKGMNYIQKPFTVNGLTKKVREVLDQSQQS
jgi:two-component system cell cycle sensor histidine kinase/response regulator CckA